MSHFTSPIIATIPDHIGAFGYVTTWPPACIACGRTEYNSYGHVSELTEAYTETVRLGKLLGNATYMYSGPTQQSTGMYFPCKYCTFFRAFPDSSTMFPP